MGPLTVLVAFLSSFLREKSFTLEDKVNTVAKEAYDSMICTNLSKSIAQASGQVSDQMGLGGELMSPGPSSSLDYFPSPNPRPGVLGESS